MIYFFHGADIEKARIKANNLLNTLRDKRPEASFFKIDSESFGTCKLDDYIFGQGIFSNKYIVFLDRLCGEKKIKDEFLSKLKDIQDSKNIFILFEGRLDKASISKIERKSDKTLEFKILEKKDNEVFDAFALADAFGKRNKKDIWISYRTAIDRGEAPEALQGMLFWKVKTMLINSVFNVYSEKELLDLSEKLITVYHESRRGKYELETGLESVILCAQ